MKTLVQYTLTLILTATFFVTSANTPYIDYLTIPEESYIDDIPFNTENIYDSIMDANCIENFFLNDEEFIDDVPFNTEAVVNGSKVFQLEEEAYINDIPFSTEQVVKRS